MPRKSKMSWRESDTQNLRRIVRNYNAKITRAAKKLPVDEVGYLPKKMSMKEAKAAIATRADYNRLTSSLQRFSRRGAETIVSSSRGAKATQYEVKEFAIKQRIDNARRTRERKALGEKEVKIAGKGQGKTRAEMGSLKENALKPSRKKFKNMSQKEWELASKNLDRLLNATDREERKRQMKENYLKGLTESGFLDENPELEQLIRDLDLETFYETVQTDETATFFFYKDPIAFEARLEALKDTWATAKKGAKK